MFKNVWRCNRWSARLIKKASNFEDSLPLWKHEKTTSRRASVEETREVQTIDSIAIFVSVYLLLILVLSASSVAFLPSAPTLRQRILYSLFNSSIDLQFFCIFTWFNYVINVISLKFISLLIFSKQPTRQSTNRSVRLTSSCPRNESDFHRYLNIQFFLIKPLIGYFN